MDIQNTLDIVSKPDFIDVVCAHVAAGGSLIDLCTTMDIHYPVAYSKIQRDPTWKEKYSESLGHCNEWLRASILRELKALASLDIRRAYDADGNLLQIQSIPADVAAAIQSIESDELYDGFGKDREHIGITRKVKFHDKLSALDKLGKTIAMFTERVDHSGQITLEKLIDDSRAVCPHPSE